MMPFLTTFRQVPELNVVYYARVPLPLSFLLEKAAAS